MLVAFSIGVVSILVVTLMTETVVAQVFAVLVAPLFVLELMFLAAIYLLWRALAGEDDDREGRRRPRASQPLAAPREEHPGQPKVTQALSERHARSRLAGWADW